MEEGNELVVAGRDVVKTFKDFWGRDKVKALKGVDIEIKKGSVFGLLGPNGAGKSTLIKLILGHLYPSSGRIAVFGKDPRNVNIKFQIGYLPERSYLYKNLTAEETLNYFGEILNLSKEQIKKRTDQLLEMVGLQHSKKRFVGEFSHGMTRRMGLAQALLNDPDFIILDEPTAGLDPVGCREVKDLIITLGNRGKTVLLTSHLLADVEDTCDQVMTIFGGKVQSKGQLNELLSDSDRLKLEFPAVDNQTLEELKSIISSKSPGHINVSSPKQSLESYFLKIVKEGNKNQETAGAREGTGVADYLRGTGDKLKSSEVSANEEVEMADKGDNTTEITPILNTISPTVIEVAEKDSDDDKQSTLDDAKKQAESEVQKQVVEDVEDSDKEMIKSKISESQVEETKFEEEKLGESTSNVDEEKTEIINDPIDEQEAVVDVDTSESEFLPEPETEKDESKSDVDLNTQEAIEPKVEKNDDSQSSKQELAEEEKVKISETVIDVMKASSDDENSSQDEEGELDEEEDEDLDEDLLNSLNL